MPAATPRMAATQAAGSQITALGGTVFLDGFNAVLRASRGKPAARAQQGADHQLVKFHECDDKARHVRIFLNKLNKAARAAALS